MSAISTHLQELMPIEVQRQIGATPDKDDDIRVLRVIDSHNDQRSVLEEVYTAMLASGWHPDHVFNRVKGAIGKS